MQNVLIWFNFFINYKTMKRILPIVLLILAGCTNPFSTREPDKPASGNVLQQANTLQNHPDSLLAKLLYAFDEKNRFYYRECFADTERVGVESEFRFLASPNERYRLTGWTLQDEINYFDKLSTNPDILAKRLQIFNKQPEWTEVSASQDSLQNRFSYEIELTYKDHKEVYKGQSIIRIMRSSQSLWYIQYWEDLYLDTKQSDSTWSTLKANYR